MTHSAKIQIDDTQETVTGDPEVARWIFESLKPLRAACHENNYTFLAYLIEMTEVEAFRLMRNQPE